MYTFGHLKANNILHRYQLIKNSHQLLEDQSIDNPNYCDSIFSAILDVNKLQIEVEEFVAYLTSVQRSLIHEIAPSIHQLNHVRSNHKSLHEKFESLFYLGWVKAELFTYQSDLQRFLTSYLSKLVNRVNNADQQAIDCPTPADTVYATDLEGSKLLNVYLKLDSNDQLDHTAALRKVSNWLFNESDNVENQTDVTIKQTETIRKAETIEAESIEQVETSEQNNIVTIENDCIELNEVTNRSIIDSKRSSPFSHDTSLDTRSNSRQSNLLKIMENEVNNSYSDRQKQRQDQLASQTMVGKQFDREISWAFCEQPPIGTRKDILKANTDVSKEDTIQDVGKEVKSAVVSWSHIVKLTSHKPLVDRTALNDEASKSILRFSKHKKKDPDTVKEAKLSNKVFLGGISSDCTSSIIIDSFQKYGKVTLQWPGIEVNYSGNGEASRAGYVFVIFDVEAQVHKLLEDCEYEHDAIKDEAGWYWTITVNCHLEERCEIKPWRLNDNQYITKKVADYSKCHCLFVGGLHGCITARILAEFLNNKYGGLASVRMDTDKWSYPTGAAKVAFHSHKSFGEAVEAGHIMISGHNFIKKLQLDPFIIKTNCVMCKTQSGPLFCRSCLEYFCEICWDKRHKTITKKRHVQHQRKINI